MLSEVRFSISELTTYNLSFEEELALLRAAPGCDGIGIFESKLPQNAKQLLRESGLSAVYCSPTVFTVLPLGQTNFPMDGPVEPEERIASMCASIHRLAELEPEVIYFATGSVGDLDESDARRIVREGAAAIADAGAAAGVRIGIEAVHPSQSFASFTHTITSTLEAVGDAEVGLLLDTWHIADVDEIRNHVDRVVGVHLADRREPNRSHFDRLMPGEGVSDVPAILRVLDDGGYDGWFEVEVLSDDGTFGEHFPDSLWDLGPVELVQRARESFDRVWEARLEAVL